MRLFLAISRSFGVVVFLLATALVMSLLGPRLKVRFKRWVTRTANTLLGIHVTLEGRIVDGPALIVSNHSSYLDIIILQSIAEMMFTPKSDIAGWPVIGTITRQFGAVFVQRHAAGTRELTGKLLARLRQGERLCVFPEATTNDGRRMKPFRSSLFALAEAWDGPDPLPVQPLSIRYECIGGQPLDDTTWPDVAWYGDDTLVAHLWRLFQHHGLQVRVICHEPLTLQPGQGRKQLAQAAERIIRQTVHPDQPLEAA